MATTLPTKAQTAAALSAIAAAQARTAVLIAAADAVTGQASLLGGVVPGQTPAQMAAALAAQQAACAQLPILRATAYTLARLAKNVANEATQGTTLTTAGGNLFKIAGQQYGDATAWQLIAAANGLTDPQIVGLVTLAIPVDPTPGTQNGGVLNG